MTTELTVIPEVSIIDIEGYQVRVVLSKELVCVRDVLNAVEIKDTADWIERLKLIVVSNHDNLDTLGMVSNHVELEYYDVELQGRTAFTNIPGVIEILAGSRKPKAKDILRAIIDKLRTRAVAPVMIDTLEALKIIIDSQIAMKAELQSVKQDMADVKADIAELKAGKEDTLLLRPIMDVSGEVRLLINDWVKGNHDNPLVTHETVHARLNLVFLYAHRRNISKLGKKYNKSALQAAIDLGMGQELLTLTRELVEHNFYGHFNEE